MFSIGNFAHTIVVALSRSVLAVDCGTGAHIWRIISAVIEAAVSQKNSVEGFHQALLNKISTSLSQIFLGLHKMVLDDSGNVTLLVHTCKVSSVHD